MKIPFLWANGQILESLMENNSHFTLVALYYFLVVHLVTIELRYMVNFGDYKFSFVWGDLGTRFVRREEPRAV
jgi:hypothetical protein